ncbi:hypothetical protein H4696_000012 [Amycolatopsis lexingtonensis]|uniref:Peptidase inhibitor family I36 n=1 Tax=Amycolatopsis lexingtonensis TaxID=218822 RepID=A0ABR9HPP5_9PSEU|nr:hypothetical protein [Amycolatopsis lexingtonensis]MBE1492912.1 hypothetical protein [Amycolatopsis lexingtonensis]
MGTTGKRLVRASLAAAGAVALLATAAPAANAATARNGICEKGEFCLYYNSYYGGSNFTYNPGGEGDLGSLAAENASHDYELVS